MWNLHKEKEKRFKIKFILFKIFYPKINQEKIFVNNNFQKDKL